MITKRNGNGQTECVVCKEKKKNMPLTWDSWLYTFNNKPYCQECLFEMLEDYKQRIDKAIEYIENERSESAERQGFYNCFPDDLYIADIEELYSILKGEDKEC